MDKTPCIYGMGYFVPETVHTNNYLSRFLDTSDEWIRTRTGIEERHVIDDGTFCEKLAIEAAKKALNDAHMNADDLSHIVVASCSADFRCPPLSSFVAGELKVRGVTTFDVNTVCSGFMSSLDICRALLFTHPSARILLVASETLTRFCNWEDRSTCVLFGDGAGAVVLGNACSASVKSPIKAYLLDTSMSSDPDGTKFLAFGRTGNNPSKHSPQDTLGTEYFIHMNGREIFKYAVRCMTTSCQEMLEKHQLEVKDIALLIPHQANIRILEAVGERLGMPKERVMTNLQRYGNTSAASVPIALCEAVAFQKIKANDTVLLTAFGGGFVWGTALLRFV